MSHTNILIVMFIVGIIIFGISLYNVAKPLLESTVSLFGIISGFLLTSVFPILSTISRIGLSRHDFASKYADHSKKLATIAKNAYGNNDLLGSVNEFTIIFPREPELDDLGITNQHLESAYPEIWSLKNLSFNESLEYLKDLVKIREDFKKRVDEVILKNSKFRSIGTTSNPDNLTAYYTPSIYLDTFKNIEYKNNARKLSLQSVSDYLVCLYSDTMSPILAMKNDFTDIQPFETEFNRIVNLLVNDKRLLELIKEYDHKKDLFYNNENRKKLNTGIDLIFKEIVKYNHDIKGNCSLCPPKSWIYRF